MSSHKAAVVAGLIAGAITAGIHTLLPEPLIERAIGLEEQGGHPPGQAVQEPLIDRPTPRWGLRLVVTRGPDSLSGQERVGVRVAHRGQYLMPLTVFITRAGVVRHMHRTTDGTAPRR